MGISVAGGVSLPGQLSFYTPPGPPGYGLFVWGRGDSGQLGLGDADNRSSPVQLGASVDWVSISSGNSVSFAINSTSELWVWGGSNNGSLGLEDTDNRSSPVQVGSLTDWTSIFSGGYQTHGIKTNGSLWSWGKNSFGQLGLNDIIDRSSPVQVGGQVFRFAANSRWR